MEHFSSELLLQSNIPIFLYMNKTKKHKLEIKGWGGESKTGQPVSQSLIYKGLENSVDFNAMLSKPLAHSARPPVIAIKPGHSREKNRVKAAAGKNMNIRKRVTAGNRVRGHGPCCNFV